MPDVRLDVVDAAELAGLLQFLAGGWPATGAGPAPPWKSSPVTPPATPASCARIWTGSPSCPAATTASPCSAPAHRRWGDDHDQPAARAQEPRRRRLRRRSSSGTPRRVRGRPSGPKTATHRLRRRPAAGLDPGDHCGPWGQEERAGPGLPPARRAARKPLQWRAHRSKPNVRTQLNWRSIVTRNGKITNLGWCQGSSEADPSRIK